MPGTRLSTAQMCLGLGNNTYMNIYSSRAWFMTRIARFFETGWALGLLDRMERLIDAAWSPAYRWDLRAGGQACHRIYLARLTS
jgi:hypothetical protein